MPQGNEPRRIVARASLAGDADRAYAPAGNIPSDATSPSHVLQRLYSFFAPPASDLPTMRPAMDQPMSNGIRIGFGSSKHANAGSAPMAPMFGQAADELAVSAKAEAADDKGLLKKGLLLGAAGFTALMLMAGMAGTADAQEAPPGGGENPPPGGGGQNNNVIIRESGCERPSNPA